MNVCLVEVKRQLLLDGARIEPGAFLVGATLFGNSPFCTIKGVKQHTELFKNVLTIWD